MEVGALVAERAAELRELGWHTLLALAAAQAEDLARRENYLTAVHAG